MTSDPTQQVFWLASRSVGVVAMALLGISVALGLAMSTKLLRRPGLPAKLKRFHEASTLVTLALVVASPTPAVRAADPVATQVSLDAPPAYAGNETTLLVTLAADTGEPVGGAQVTLERRTGGAWGVVATLTTDAEGRASQRLPLERDPRDNVVRVRYDGDTEHAPADRQARLELKRRLDDGALDCREDRACCWRRCSCHRRWRRRKRQATLRLPPRR